MPAAAALLLLGAGCTLFFDPPPADEVPGRCGPFGGFEEPKRVPGVEPGADDPAMTRDLRELYFDRGESIFMATRSGPDIEQWTPQPAPVFGLEFESSPTLSASDLSLWFCAGEGNAEREILVAKRDEVGDPWGDPDVVSDFTELEGRVCPCWVDQEETRMILRANGISQDDFYLATREDPGEPWDYELLRAEVGEARDAFYVPCAGELWFSVVEEGTEDEQVERLYVTPWDGVTVPADRPATGVLSELERSQGDPWLARAGELLLLAVKLEGGRAALYQASRSPE